MGSVTVPEVASTITRLVEFTEHLEALLQSPSEEIDVALLDHVYLQLNAGNTDPLLPVLLPQLAALLQVYMHDLAPLAKVTTKLIQNHNISQIKAALGLEGASHVNVLIVAALSSPSPAANKLGLTLITACAREGQDAIRRMSDANSLIETLISVWLCSPDAGVGAEATKTLLRLLEVDEHHDDSASPGETTVWDKFFSPNCQRTIYDKCMIQSTDDKSTRDQKTLAQGRLLEALPCMVRLNPRMPIRSLPDTDWTALTSSGNPCESYLGQPKDSLIHLAAFHMVDPEDVPMAVLLTRFWEQLVLSLDIAKIDALMSPGKDYARVLAIVVSGTSENAQRISTALASLPTRFENKEDQDRITDLLRGLLFQASGHAIQGAP